MNNKASKVIFHPFYLFFFINVLFLLPQQAFPPGTVEPIDPVKATTVALAKTAYDRTKKEIKDDIADIIEKFMKGENTDTSPFLEISLWLKKLISNVRSPDKGKPEGYNQTLRELFKATMLELIKNTDVTIFLKPFYHKAEQTTMTILHQLTMFDDLTNNERAILHPALEEIAQAILDKIHTQPSPDLKAMLNSGAYDYKLTPLHLAVINNNPSLVKIFLDMGIDPFKQTELSKNNDPHNGNNPFHCAFENITVNQAIVAKFLAKEPTLINTQNRNKKTAAHLLANREHIENDILPILLKNGADLTIKDENGKTPLHYAASRGHVGYLQPLIDAGAKIDEFDKSHATPLHCAVDKAMFKVAEYLIEHGADCTLPGSFGSTVLDQAKVHGNPNEIAFLQKAYAAKSAEKAKILASSSAQSGTKAESSTDRGKQVDTAKGAEKDKPLASSSLNPLNIGLTVVAGAVLLGTFSWFYKKNKNVDQEVMNNDEVMNNNE